MLQNLILLLPCFVCLFGAMNLLCKWKKAHRAQRLLAICLILLSVLFFILANYFAGVTDYSMYYKLDIVDSFVTLLIYPLTYFYFKVLTDERPFGWKDYIWLLPSLVVGGGTAWLYGLMGEDDAIVYVREMLTDRNLLYINPLYRMHYFISVVLYNRLLMIEGLVVVVYACYRVMRYRRRLNEFYSNLEGKSMKMNYAVLASFLISTLFALITACLGRFFLYQYPMLVNPLFISWSVIFYFLYYQGSQLEYTVETFADDLRKADEEAYEQGYASIEDTGENSEGMCAVSTSNLKKKFDPELILRFNSLMDGKHVYLKNDLRLDELARLMRTNRTYISRLINEEYGCTFSELINRKRIEYAQILMCADHSLTQEYIACKSGFLHSSTFSRTFKQQVGVTFREWQKKVAHA